MPTVAPDISLAAAYGKKFAKGIILSVWKALAEQGITIYPTIKGPTKFGKMTAQKGLKPYTGTFSATGDVKFTDRELTPALATYEMFIEPLKYYNTWMADMISASASKKQIPFENAMWQEVVSEIVTEFIDSFIYLGDTTYAGADNARKIANGLQLAVIDIAPSEVATGAIALATVIDQIEEVYMSIPSTKRKFLMNVYVSQTTKDLYDQKYRALYHDKPTYNEFGQAKLDIGNGKALLKPVDWLVGDEIIVAPPNNLVIGTDAESDMSTIKMIEDVYGYKAAITFSAGAQIPDKDFLFINDQVIP